MDCSGWWIQGSGCWTPGDPISRPDHCAVVNIVLLTGGTRVVFIEPWTRQNSGKVFRKHSSARLISWPPLLHLLYGSSCGSLPWQFNHLNILLGKSITGREWLVEQASSSRLSLIKGDWKYIEPGQGPKIQVNTNTENREWSLPQLYQSQNGYWRKEECSTWQSGYFKELTELCKNQDDYKGI